MSSVVTITIVLVILVSICLILIFLHNRSHKKQAGSLLQRFKKIMLENKLKVAVTETLKKVIFGIDPHAEKLLILQQSGDKLFESGIIDLTTLKNCRKQKKWIHIPAGKINSRPETHLEKMMLLLEFTGSNPPLEIVFYEYRYNSLFQLHELEQKADYWELVVSKKLYKQKDLLTLNQAS